MTYKLLPHCETNFLFRRCEERSDAAIQYSRPTSRNLIAGSMMHQDRYFSSTFHGLTAGSRKRLKKYTKQFINRSFHIMDPAVKPRDVGVRFLVVCPKLSPNIIKQKISPHRHCEERSDAVIQKRNYRHNIDNQQTNRLSYASR